MLSIEQYNLEFIWPWSSLFLILPIFMRTLLPRDNYVMALRVPFFKRITDLPKSDILDKKNFKNLFISLFIWSFFVIAGMRPQWVGEPTDLPLTGRSLMLAVDLSGSMKEKDIFQNKIASLEEKNKQLLSRLERLEKIAFGKNDSKDLATYKLK